MGRGQRGRVSLMERKVIGDRVEEDVEKGRVWLLWAGVPSHPGEGLEEAKMRRWS